MSGIHPEGVSTRSRLLSNTLVQFVSPAFRMVLGLVLAAVLSRYLGVTGFGQYAIVFAYVATFSGVLNEWGLGTVCLREISRRREERATLVAASATLQALISLGTYTVMLSSLLLLPYPRPVKICIAVYGLTVLLMPLDLLCLPFQADLRLSRLVLPSVMSTALNLLLIVTVISLGGPLLALVTVALVSLLLQYAWVTILSLKALKFEVRLTRAHWGFLLREAWPLGVSAIVSTAFQQAPLIVLSLFSLEAVGLFNAANKIPQQLYALPLAVRATMFPLLSASWVRDRDRFTRHLQRLIEGSLLFSIPAAIVGIGLAGPIMRLLFGASFSAAAIPFALLIAIFGFLFPGILLGEALIAAGFQRLNVAINTASLPLLLLLLVLLVPAHGAWGAALALLMSYLFMVTASFVAARHFLCSMPLGGLSGAAIAASLGAGATLGLSAFLGPVPSAMTGGLVAFSILVLLQPVTVRDLWALRPVAIGGTR